MFVSKENMGDGDQASAHGFLHYFCCTCVLLVVCLLHVVFCSDSQSGWCLFSWSLPDSAIWGLEQSVSSPYKWWSLKWLPGLDIEV